MGDSNAGSRLEGVGIRVLKYREVQIASGRIGLKVQKFGKGNETSKLAFDTFGSNNTCTNNNMR